MRNTPLLLLSSIFRRQYDALRRRSLPPLPAPAFVYITHGDGLLRIDGSTHAIEPHQVCLFVPGMKIEVEPHGGAIGYYLLFVRCVTAEGPVRPVPAAALSPLTPGVIRLRRDEAAYDRMKSLYDAARSPSASGFEVNALFQEWISHMLRHVRPTRDKETARPADGIQLSIAHMHRHFHRKLTLQTLAEIAGFTPTSYSREFKKIKGVSPIDYLNAHRIQHAKQLLLSKRYTVKEVSSASGFGNEFYFSRMFKREVGVSPTLYMKRRDIRVAAVSCLRFHDTLESLGVRPVFSDNWHQVKTANREEHEAVVAKHFEHMRRAQPELIIGDSYHLPYLERLKQIAPTYILDYSMDWRAICRQIAALVGREKEAERCMEQADSKLDEARGILRRRFGDETFTLMRVVHKLIRIQGASQHPLNEMIYGELGFKPGYSVPANLMNIEFSPDKYPVLDTDHLLIQNRFYFPDDEAVLRGIQQTDQWRSIRAVSCGRVHYIDNWFGMSWSAAGRIRIIEDLLAL